MAKLEPFLLRDYRQGRYTPSQVGTSLVPLNSASHSSNFNYDTIVGSAVVRPGTTLLGDPVAPNKIPLGLSPFVGKGGTPNLLLSVFEGVGPGVTVGTGTISDDGSGNITGVGTIFTTELAVGYVIIVGSTFATITMITDDTDMVVSVPTGASSSAFSYTGVASIYYYNTSWHASTKKLTNGTRNRFATLGGSSFVTNSTDGMFDSIDGNTWGQSNSIASGGNALFPSVVQRYTAQLVAAGDPTYPDRVFFSSVVDPVSSPFITWNTDPTTGDWIDINPDDGGYVTGFSETSTFLIVFKNTGMYRMDTLTKTTDAENIYNIGAVSQEAIILCQGIVYYFSGLDIRRTNGGFPDQISRAGVQDIINAIPQANWIEVYGWTDGLSVYFSIGNITLFKDQNRQFTIPNCVIKFSPRDQSWSVHSYSDRFKYGGQYTDSNGALIRATDIKGEVQTINLGTTDNGEDIHYEFESQDLEFGNRSRLKQLSDKLIVYMSNGIDSTVQFRMDGADIKDVPMATNERVNIGKDIDIQANFFNFRLIGSSKGTPPTFEGFQLEDISDLGTTTKHG